MRNSAPRVSVVLPTYNRADYVVTAAASVLDQTYTDLELIVVDDGSNDGTSEAIAELRDPRVRYIFQENAGRSRARNLALRSARGEYIAFQDSDDVYLPHKLRNQVDFMDDHTDFGMVYTAAACIDAEGKSLNFGYGAPVSGWIYPHIAFYLPTTVTLPTVMLRRSLLNQVGLFDESLERFEDTDLWRRMAKRSRVAALAEVTCLVRTHPGNDLVCQDPKTIEQAIDYYVQKAFRDDASEIDVSVLQAGARRLYLHYGQAMLGVPEFAEFGRRLIQKGRRHFEPKVSIVIPVYNGADYLADALNSALHQTYWNIEVVVVNDGSNDNGATESVALRFGDRIRYFSKPNGGVASALNFGISKMTGDYFAWLSHDDLYALEKLEIQIAALSQQPEPQSCILYCDYSVFTESPNAGHPVRLPHTPPDQFRFFITANNVLHGCSLLIPRRALQRYGGFDERLRTTQDYDLWFRMAETERFVHLPAVLVHARSHEAQGTHRMKDIVLQECDDLLAGFVSRLSEEEISRGTALAGPAAYLEIGCNLHRRGFRAAAKEAMRAGLNSLEQTITHAAPPPTTRSIRKSLEGLYWDLSEARLQIEDLKRQRSEEGAAERECEALRRKLQDVQNSESRTRSAQTMLERECESLRRRLQDVLSSSHGASQRPCDASLICLDHGAGSASK